MEVGDQFPEFEVSTHHGKKLTKEDVKGKAFVLFAYPRAMTPGCTKEVCSVRDHFKEIKERGVIPFGISNDPIEKNKKFAEKHGLPYELLSDENNDLLEKLSWFGEKKMYGKTYMGTKRHTMIVDQNGTIRKIFKKVKTSEHGQEILDALDELGL